MKKYFIQIVILLLSFFANAQEQSKDSLPASEFTIDISYQSQAVEAGRTYNVKQYSIVPSLSYNHKSGIFVSADGYLFSQSTPAFSLTVITVGYLHKFENNVSLSGSYARNIFTNDTAGLIQNQFSGAFSFEKNWFSVSAGYTYLSGGETGHVITVTSSGYWEKELNRMLDVISVNPAIILIAGTNNVPLRSFSKTIYEQGYQRPWIQRRRTLTGITNTEVTARVFGPLSITASAPVSFTKGAFSINLGGNIAIPFQLRDEETGLQPQFFVTAGVSVTIQ